VTQLTRRGVTDPIGSPRSPEETVRAETAGSMQAEVQGRLYGAPRPAVGVPSLALACGAALAAAWPLRHERYLVPDSGLGYALGIGGLSLLVLLLAYPLRKRLRALRSWGRLPIWFQVHMLLGVLGPTAILFHSNFRVRSLNSGVALASMLLVAGSGFVGRFIHTRIHRGLFDRRQTLERLRREAESARSATRAILRAMPELAARLRSFESWALAPGVATLPVTPRLWRLGREGRATERACRRILRRAGLPEGPRVIRAHVRAVRRVAEFRAYERLFSVWHALHVPLCVLLFAAAAVHVLAVHLY
jgi:hypothetical protein